MGRFYDMNKVYVLGGAQMDFERNWTKEGKRRRGDSEGGSRGQFYSRELH